MRKIVDVFDKKSYLLKMLKKQNITEEDKKYIKKCLVNKNISLSNDQRFMLVKLVGDEEFIKKCVENSFLDLGLDREVDLVQEIKDNKYIKNYIKQKNIVLSNYYKCQLIKKTKDIEYIKECVKDKSLELESFYKLQLIMYINDKEFTKECIKDKELELKPDAKVILIIKLKDKEFIKECVKDQSLELGIKEKINLIVETGDFNYILKCIIDDNLILKSKDKVELIKQTGNPEFIKKCINDENIRLSTEDKVKLIKCIKDPNYIKACIEDEKLNLTDREKLILILNTKNGNMIENFINNKEDNIKKINLPEGMTAGIEIEAEGFGTLRQTLFNGWRAKQDNSLKDGTEIVSPILLGTEKDSNEIYNICNMLKMLKSNVSERCGGHVHIGADYLTTYQSYINLVEIWGNVEEILYLISNQEGEITRFEAVSKYAVPISEKIDDALKKGTINITDEMQLSDFVHQLQLAQYSRHTGINFMNISNPYKKTIEFRISNGTIEPETWVENINLFGGIISASEKLNKIQLKIEEERTEEEQQYLKKFEKLKDTTILREEKLENLLELTVPKEEREIYRNRYKVNSKIFDKEAIILGELRKRSTGGKALDFKKAKETLSSTKQKEGDER